MLAGADDGFVVIVVFAVHEFAVFGEHQGRGVLVELAPRERDVDQAVALDVLVEQMEDEALPDDGAPEADAALAAVAEELVLMVVVRLDDRVVDPGQDGRQVVGLEGLAEREDELDDHAHLFVAVELLLGIEAVVAHTAVLLRIVFAEVVEQDLAAALVGFGVGDRLHQQLLADLLLGDGLALHEFLEPLDVLVAVERDALALAAVAAGAPRLLIIAFQALGDVVVDHEADVGLVDAHAEGDGGHDHVDFFHQEGVLVVGTRDGVHTGVVGQGLDAVDVQQLRDFFHFLAAEAVDDAALAGVVLDELDDVALGVGLVADFVIEVLAVEGILEHLGVQHAEVLLDVRLDLRGGGGGQGDDGRLADLADDFADAAVFRPEIVAPLRDAVGFVDGVERDGKLLEQLDVLVFGQGFGRHVEEFGDPGEKVGFDFGDLRLVERGIQEVGDALPVLDEAADGVDLVFHQGDQGGDDDGRPLQAEGRELIAQ